MTFSAVDVSSPESILNAAYDLISGRADEPRDWERFRSLHAPGARLIRVNRSGSEIAVEVFDVDSYERSRTPILAAADFHEREVGRRIERFQDMAHIWSAYEARRSPDGAPLLRGINSLQLVHRDARWWIVTAMWQNAQPDMPVQEELLFR